MLGRETLEAGTTKIASIEGQTTLRTQVLSPKWVAPHTIAMTVVVRVTNRGIAAHLTQIVIESKQ